MRAFRLHRNLGHPSHESFIRALKHAQVKDEVLEYVKRHFTCPICLQRQKPKTPRPGHLAHGLKFNDVIFLEYGGEPHAFLNVICWGTGLQNVTYLPQKTASQTMTALTDSWLAPYGPPTLLVTDQGREFTGREFAYKLNSTWCDGAFHRHACPVASRANRTSRRSAQTEAEAGGGRVCNSHMAGIPPGCERNLHGSTTDLALRHTRELLATILECQLLFSPTTSWTPSW